MDDFCWFGEIAEYNNEMRRFVFNEQKLRYLIEKYGVDAKDKRGGLLVFILESLSFDLIDVVFEYKPKFMYDNACYLPGVYRKGSKNEYILKRALEQDVEGKYMQKQFRFGDSIYYNIVNFYDDVCEYRSDIMKEYIKRHITLFEMLINKVDLYNNNKIRRVY